MLPRAPTSTRHRAALVAVATLLAACGGKPKEAETPETPAPLQEDVPPDISEDPTSPGKPLSNDGPKQVSGPEASAKESDPAAQSREITPRECQSLAGKYGALTRSDETAKLSPKLNDKQRAQADESISAAAQKLEARWAESCESSLVGKVAEEQALQCAMNAKNVAAFDTCLNGPK
jgi:hypothetical protein